MKKQLINGTLAVFATMSMLACKKQNDIIVIVEPSDGSNETLSGGTGGANAVNSVFFDFSTDKQDAILRQSWDLGFYSGTDFRVVLNHTTSAGVKVTTKNDLAQVTAADTIGLTLAVSQTAPQPSDFSYFDDIAGDITKTAIPAVSATDADNKVIILNRGTGGGIAARPWIKLRVLRNAGGGYTLQYAGITESTFSTVQVSKDAEYNFRFVSLDNGNIVPVEPKKELWDMQWSYSVFKTFIGGGDVPYNFSDLVLLNHHAGVKAAQVLTSTVAYNDYSESHVAATTFSSDRWTIGSNWRATTGTVGVKTDRFYVIKDAAGNVYKLKFISFHANDGGVRGFPVIEYKLVKKG
jgi:heme-binding HmuY-like protein